MCGRYSITTPPEAMRELFEFPEMLNLAPRYNLAPTQAAPVVRVMKGQRQLTMMRWGLVPPWAPDMSGAARLINARSETALEKPSFKEAFAARPCLIPADGFYEWQKRGREKQAYRIELQDRQAFAFAGIWESWHGDDGLRETFAILTTAAAPSIAAIHHRMPVILIAADFDKWLQGSPHQRQQCCTAYGGDDLLSYPIAAKVGAVSNDDASVLRPVEIAQKTLF
jgi:putative SOS response-associated peptidase YedK